ncbi:MAG: SDR family oxidoreductase, partial [Erysipelotrichaceae bacterium]|nr:SDR family oxidoreductase [Erysipelotrichaceae bacterium]
IMNIAIISGGTSGIGFATVKKFLSEGYKVVIAGIDSKEKIENAMSELETLGEVTFIECDVSDEKQCQNVVEETIKKYGKIDVLANVAGIVGVRAPFIDSELQNIKKVIDVNLNGSINLAYYVSQYMVKARSGVIVNVGSICGFMANTEAVGYHASKGGVKLLTQALARELSPYGIRVVSVAPGWVKTAMMGGNDEAFGNSLHLKGRVILPEEIANAIYLLTTKEASAINGTTVMVDDGYTSFKGIDGYQAQ